MGQSTGIAWTDATWNPIRGCSRVSEGCRHCYAEVVAARFSGPGQPYEGMARKVGGEARWTGEVRFIEKHLTDPLRWRNPKRIFVNSMSDLFHEKVEDAWLDRIFAVMALAPRHTFQVLTKRPERMRAYLTDRPISDRIGARLGLLFDARMSPLPNVHLGVSVEDQAAADERIPLLLRTPAAVRWVSAEPLLGPVDFWACGSRGAEDGDPFAFSALTGTDGTEPPIPGLDWVVVGGESGPGHRPMDLAWARALRDQCAAAGIPFFFKQRSGPKAGLIGGVFSDLLVREFPR